jgi:hypothetical protein
MTLPFTKGTTMYEIDWDKIQSVHDLKLILQSLDLSFTKHIYNFREMQHLLREKQT